MSAQNWNVSYLETDEVDDEIEEDSLFEDMFAGETGMNNEERLLQRTILKNLISGKQYAYRARQDSIQK